MKTTFRIVIILIANFFFYQAVSAQNCSNSLFPTSSLIPGLHFDHAGMPAVTMINQHDGTGSVHNQFITVIDADIPSKNLYNYSAFCSEMGAVVQINTEYTSFQVVPLQNLASEYAGVAGTASVLIPFGGIGITHAGIVRYLYDKHFVSTAAGSWSPEQCAAFQMAIWEVTHDQFTAIPNFSVITPSLNGFYYDYIANTTQGKLILDTAQAWLSDVNNKSLVWSNYASTKWHIVGLQSAGNIQDLILAEPIIVCSATLPLKLFSFNAALNNNEVVLKWATTDEINVSHFTIEKSTDGINFTSAGFKTADRNTKNSYTFSDNVALQTANVYYRLRSIDFDGRNEVSEIRIIKLGKTSGKDISINTYPNPVTNEIRVNVPASWQNKKVTYEVLNTSGALVKKIENNSSKLTEIINVSTLNTGFYIVRVNCNGESAQQKIIKN
jgi:hypothetical protein